MGRSVSESRRVIRPLFTAFLILTSATAGYYWGIYTSNNFAHRSDYMISGAALVLFAILASTVLDFIHARVDDSFDVDAQELERLTKAHGTEVASRQDMQRALDEITRQNLRLMKQLSRMNHHPK